MRRFEHADDELVAASVDSFAVGQSPQTLPNICHTREDVRGASIIFFSRVMVTCRPFALTDREFLHGTLLEGPRELRYEIIAVYRSEFIIHFCVDGKA